MHEFGWLNRPDEVEKISSQMGTAQQLIQDENLTRFSQDGPVLPFEIVRKLIKSDLPDGPQKIGDCVSWGWGNSTNAVALMQIASKLSRLGTLELRTNNADWIKDAQDHQNYQESQNILEEYQECCTEVIYALSRVEVGGQRGSREDGSVGAWAAKAVTTYGTLSRKKLGPYDPKRAKDWGADGLPDNLEPEAKQHIFKECVPVTDYQTALTLTRSYRPIPVCSDQGFTEQRDSKGRCRPSGRWMHCMYFWGCDENGWLLLHQSWGKQSPTGPVYLNQPTNSWFVDPDTCDRMLRQKDTYAPARYLGYEVEDFISWKH